MAQLAFKYYFLDQFRDHLWDETQILMRLPTHPNIVTFDRVVVDESEGSAVVGFTARYIPGGTFEQGKHTFKLKHLRQLINVIDELNYTHGIAHQDVAPRNLLLDEATDNIMLFDFNFSSRPGHLSYHEERDDTKGLVFTVYELITGDISFRSVPFEEQRMSDVTDMAEWVPQRGVKLDRSAAEYRTLVTEWSKGRADARLATATIPVIWPALPDPPLREFPSEILQSDGTVKQCTVTRPSVSFLRSRAERDGRKVLRWERPSTRRLTESGCASCNG